MEYMAGGLQSKVMRSEVSLSDHELWSQIIRYGEAARMWRQKFLGLLPEVARRELWKTHGFESVFVFAFKVGGVSEAQVRRVLNLDEAFKKTPQLRSLLVKGKVSSNKLVRVASVATVENQEVLVNQVQLLSQGALETFVRDMRMENKAESVRTHAPAGVSLGGAPAGTLASASLGGVSLGGAPTEAKFSLTLEAEQKLQELHNKGIDISEFILTAATQREQDIQEAKENIMVETEQKRATKLPSRHIPQKIKNLIKKEFGTKCAITNCNKLSREIHHTARFSLSKSHDPNLLAPLCKSHHQIAHSIDVKYQECRRL